MTPNEGYQRRLGDWEKKERDRKEAYPDKPYDPAEMKGHVPLGCILVGAAMLVGLGYFIYRLIKLGIIG